MNSFSLVSASPEFGGKCRALRGDRGMLAYTGQNINTHILCQILHSTPYFFVSLFPIAFYRRSRMTGRYLLPFCKKLFYLSAPTCLFRQPDGFSAGVIFLLFVFTHISFFLHVKRPPPWFGEVFIFYFFYFLPMCLAL